MGSWSVVLEIESDPYVLPCLATARFLVETAPHDRLRSGVEFEMLEGPRVTAMVRVL